MVVVQELIIIEDFSKEGVGKVVKSEGAGTQTIRNLGIKVYTCYQENIPYKEVSYSHILLVLYMASFSYI